jgi:hypothetical protein
MLSAMTGENLSGIPVHNAIAMKIHKTGGQLCCPEAYYAFREVAFGIKMIYHGIISALRMRNGNRDLHRRSPPSIRSRTKKQLSSSWKA